MLRTASVPALHNRDSPTSFRLLALEVELGGIRTGGAPRYGAPPGGARREILLASERAGVLATLDGDGTACVRSFSSFFLLRSAALALGRIAETF
mmetsp:Transcript_44975/g.104890  ORF Transcript_44975/g.104890 Transcript_44975/m.104890 type:complete len:95 (-) Transcript_44975:31-315(-)